MRNILLFFAFASLFACNNEQQHPTANTSTPTNSAAISMIQHQRPDFQALLDSVDMKGAILVHDVEANTFYSNNYDNATQGYLPASTFKIPNSIIALETGVVEDDSTLFKWDGQPRWLKAWEKDLVFRDAFHLSCVPCYQEVARKVGATKMRQLLDTLEYGHIVVDSASIDVFWLEGESKINAFEQIDFLKRFYAQKLPIQKRTFDLMREMMVIEQKENWKLSGKTGWSNWKNKDIGWFVGAVETNNKLFLLAINIQPASEKTDMDQFIPLRKKLALEAFRLSIQ